MVGLRTKKGSVQMDLSIFATPEAWISLVTLMFLEIVLGVDNAMLWATIPAFILAFKGSYFGTIAVGMIATALIRYFT